MKGNLVKEQFWNWHFFFGETVLLFKSMFKVNQESNYANVVGKNTFKGKISILKKCQGVEVGEYGFNDWFLPHSKLLLLLRGTRKGQGRAQQRMKINLLGWKCANKQIHKLS